MLCPYCKEPNTQVIDSRTCEEGSAIRRRRKCPNCGAVLTIKKIAGLETKSIPCPVCKKASKYIDYKVPKQQYTPPNENDDTTMGDETHIDHSKNQSIGKLQKIGTSHIYTLSLGINTIGRKAQTSNATVQIDTDDLTMSRSHSIIEVRKLKTGGYIHYFSNAQNKNATYINSGLIENGDRIILHGGEIIKMSNTTLKFILLSEDDTII